MALFNRLGGMVAISLLPSVLDSWMRCNRVSQPSKVISGRGASTGNITRKFVLRGTDLEANRQKYNQFRIASGPWENLPEMV